jgi:hypothetical protein
VAAAVVGYALVAALCRPLTAPALVAVLIPGIALLWLGLRRRSLAFRPPPAPESSREAVITTRWELPGRQGATRWRSVLPWAGLATVGGVVELALRFGPNDLAHPTLSTLADPALATYPGRVLGYVLWLSAGVWLVSR